MRYLKTLFIAVLALMLGTVFVAPSMAQEEKKDEPKVEKKVKKEKVKKEKVKKEKKPVVKKEKKPVVKKEKKEKETPPPAEPAE